MKTPRVRHEKSAVELVEEAFHLLRGAPGNALFPYVAGTLPFILAGLFFVSDMSRHAFAAERLLPGSFGLACLFLVMKGGQTLFTSRLLTHLAGETPTRWTGARLLRMLSRQAMIQPAGLLLLPVAFALLLPFGWTYAFFANATVLGAEEDESFRAWWNRVWEQSFLWPLQNHYALMMYKLLYWFVFLNLGVMIILLPFLYKMLLGVETMFTASPEAMINTTFFSVCFGLAYLCLDPLIKTTYVLRCFYGESLQTGRDLRADLQRLRQDEAHGLSEGTT